MKGELCGERLQCNFDRKCYGRFVLSVFILAACCHSIYADALVNGDFELGDTTGWTAFRFNGGTLLGPEYTPVVQAFDVDGDGSQSLSAKFSVGNGFGVSFPSRYGGGGLSQMLTLAAGSLSIDVDIACHNPTESINESGGLFQLWIDEKVVDTHDFGRIYPLLTERSHLKFTADVVTAGPHTIAINILRDATFHPEQYVDNFRIGGTAVVPEPTTALLLVLGCFTIQCLRNRRKSRAVCRGLPD